MDQLIYISTAKDDLEFEDIQALLTTSITKNLEKNITGMMTYDKSYFIQCIEGEREDIKELYKKIEQDSRHYNIKLLGREEISERAFETWNLGYINNSSVIKDVIESETGLTRFEVYKFNFEQAKKILYRLSFLI